MRRLLMTTILFTLAAHSAWAGPHFDGSYKGDGSFGPMTVVLHQAAGGAVSGTMSNEEETYQVSGSPTGDGVHATFTGPQADDSFEGDLTLRDGHLSMDLVSSADPSIKAHLDFDRSGGVPSTKPDKVPAKHKPVVVSPPAPAHVTQSYSGWKTYRNATGISIKYPSAWSANETGGVLKFVPSDAGSGRSRPADVSVAPRTHHCGAGAISGRIQEVAKN